MAEDDPLKSLQSKFEIWSRVLAAIDQNTQRRRTDHEERQQQHPPICSADRPPLDSDSTLIHHSNLSRGMWPIKRTTPRTSTPASSKVSTGQPIDRIPYTVLYDYEAQSQLAEMVKDLSHTARGLRSVPHRILRDIDVKLQLVTELCEKCAYQLLRDGGCQPYLDSIVQAFEDMSRICHKEHIPNSESLSNTKGNLQASVPAKNCQVNVTGLECDKRRDDDDDDDDHNDDDDDDDDDESDRELTLASVRLTSRLRAS